MKIINIFFKKNAVKIFFILLFFLYKNISVAETVTYIHSDLLGSPISASNNAGVVSWSEGYEPYGSRLINNPLAISLGFTGAPQDTETGLVYLGGRFYDPTIGRFISVDSVSFTTENAQSFNRYSYANNNPQKYIDPKGNFAFLVPLLWVTGVAALSAYSDYANAPMDQQDIHTKPAYEPIFSVVGAPMKVETELVSASAKGLIGKDFESFLVNKLGGVGSFKVGGREFDGAIGSVWYEAKSGGYWDQVTKSAKAFEKFKSDMGARLRIAKDNSATYELHSNTVIPDTVRDWLTNMGIKFTEHP